MVLYGSSVGAGVGVGTGVGADVAVGVGVGEAINGPGAGGGAEPCTTTGKKVNRCGETGVAPPAGSIVGGAVGPTALT